MLDLPVAFINLPSNVSKQAYTKQKEKEKDKKSKVQVFNYHAYDMSIHGPIYSP